MNIKRKFFSINENSNYKIVTIFWIIRIKVKRRFKILYEEIRTLILKEMANIETRIMASNIHPDTFKNYANIFTNKFVYLIAPGPSLEMFDPNDHNGIYVGVNRAFLYNKVKLDFLFIQDYLEKEQKLADDYIGNNCIKFYGIIPNIRLRNLQSIKRIPMSSRFNSNALTYILAGKLKDIFAYDLSNEPIGDFLGTVFSAMQFILYTHPKKIFLVGCDCSQGYFNGSDSKNNAEYQIEIWKKIAKFANEIYPDVKIISINPVGLKGVFEDIYIK